VTDQLRDYFLKIDGIEGESQDKVHTNEIRLSDFAVSMTKRGPRAHYGVGRAVFQDVTFSGPIDRSYPKLEQALAQNTQINKVVLTCRKAGTSQMDFLTITFGGVYLKSCRIEGSTAVPQMAFSIGFRKTEITYREQTAKGWLGGPITAAYELGHI
jgi:type VI secretion system secreted protein Hcp